MTTAKFWPVLTERFSPRINRNWILATSDLPMSDEFRVCLVRPRTVGQDQLLIDTSD